MSYSHTNHSKNDNSLKFGMILNGLYAFLGLAVGLLTGSLTLIADAMHNITDNFTLSVSYIANRLSKRPANPVKTFGYGRATILAALLNASFLIAVAILVAIEAVGRLRNPVTIEGGIVAVIASIGIFVNAFIAYKLSKNREDLNMRSAYIDQLADTVSSIATVFAGLIILTTDIQYIDSIFALLIVGFLLFNTLKILKEAVHILFEGTPIDTDIDDITKTINADPKIIGVDDLHVWAIRSGYNAVSCHVVISESDIAQSRNIVDGVKKILRSKCNIQHSTIEIEFRSSRHSKHHEGH